MKSWKTLKLSEVMERIIKNGEPVNFMGEFAK